MIASKDWCYIAWRIIIGKVFLFTSHFHIFHSVLLELWLFLRVFFIFLNSQTFSFTLRNNLRYINKKWSLIKKKELDNLLIKMKIAFLLLFNGTWNFSTCNYWWNWVLLSNLIDWKWWNRILKDIPSGYLHTFVELLTQHQKFEKLWIQFLCNCVCFSINVESTDCKLLNITRRHACYTFNNTIFMIFIWDRVTWK